MKAAELENLLVRLSLDSQPDFVGGCFEGFRILSTADGGSIYAKPATVLVKVAHERFEPRPGMKYIILDREGCPVREFQGRKQHPGQMRSTYAEFAQRYGSLFGVQGNIAAPPADPFEGLLAALR